MPQKNNHDFKGKYPYVCVGTLVSIRITGFFCREAAFQNMKKRTKVYMGIKIVVDRQLNSS